MTYQDTFSSGDEIFDTFNLLDEEVQDIFDFIPVGFDTITPYYRPDAQLADSSGRGTIATQKIGGIKPSNYEVLINGTQQTDVIIDPDGYNEWTYDIPLWYGHNPFRITLYNPDMFDYIDVFVQTPFHMYAGDIDDSFAGEELVDTFEFVEEALNEAIGPNSLYLYGVYQYQQDIFLERVYVPKQPGVVILDGYEDIEGTYYEEEGYGAVPDAYGSTKVLYACGKVQFPSKLRVKYITSRELSSGVIYNGTEPVGYDGYKVYFGPSPLFDDHVASVIDSVQSDPVMVYNNYPEEGSYRFVTHANGKVYYEPNLISDGYQDGYKNFYYTTRTEGYGDGTGTFRNPLRRYGTEEYVVVDGYEQLSIVPNVKYDLFDEAENQLFAISHAINESHVLADGQTSIYLTQVPEVIDEIQIYREYDFKTRIPAATAIDFDPTRMLLSITPFEADGYGTLIARVAYTYRGIGTTLNNPSYIHNFPNRFRVTPDGYSVDEDLLERYSLEFDFVNSLKWDAYGCAARNYETEILGSKTMQKLRMVFFKQNNFEIETQLNPGFDILSPERIARVGNDLNESYYDNGKREIIIQTDYRGLDLEVS